LYSLFAAQKVGPHGTVWAFEPSQREYQRLTANLKLNLLCERVRGFSCALSDINGSADITIAEEEHAGQNTLGSFAYESVKALRNERVQTRVLDSLAEENGLKRLDLLKIDVEGAEPRVIKGASGVLRRLRPVILLEVSEPSLRAQGSSREALLTLLRTLDYRLYVFDDNTGLPAFAAAGVFGDNMLAVPVEMHLPDSVTDPTPSKNL
jgi:FkbM family methyltransferase